jgi:hypothetical protein
MGQEFTIDVRFYRLSEELQPYFTALYAFDIDCTDGRVVEDYLHPEWTAMRFCTGAVPLACIGPGELAPQWPFVASGPTSKTLHFGITSGKIWGLGLQPAGWARFASGPASELSDRTVDGSDHAALALFRPIQAIVQQPDLDPDGVAERINALLMQHARRRPRQEDLIFACQQALRDPDIANVAELGGRLGLNARSLERLCSRYFGFPPKLLLRRQRFLRSLASYMLDGDRIWSSALDGPPSYDRRARTSVMGPRATSTRSSAWGPRSKRAPCSCRQGEPANSPSSRDPLTNAARPPSGSRAWEASMNACTGAQKR